MSPRSLLALPLALLSVLLGACDLFGPGGPGTVTAHLQRPGEGLGAAVVRVSGPGIRGFSAAADARVFHGDREGEDGHRVVVVNAAGEGLVFGIEVEELGAAPPAVRVLAAADTANAPLPDPGSVVVRLER